MEVTRGNRDAWDVANRTYADHPERLDHESLAGVEVALLAPLLAGAPRVVHLQSGNGVDCIELLRAGASSAVGVDFSVVGVRAATARAARLGSAARYVVGTVPQAPLARGCADLVYTGKGALCWLDDLTAWAGEVARLLAPGGALFVYDAHPAAALWTRDPVSTSLEPGRSYFGGTRANDSFPASAIARYSRDEVEAVEVQWTLADIVNGVLGAGMTIEHLGEHAEPFWRPGDAPEAAAWRGDLPNSFTLLARAVR